MSVENQINNLLGAPIEYSEYGISSKGNKGTLITFKQKVIYWGPYINLNDFYVYLIKNTEYTKKIKTIK